MIFNDIEETKDLVILKLWTFRILYVVCRLQAPLQFISNKWLLLYSSFPIIFNRMSFFYLRAGNTKRKNRPFRWSCFNLIKKRGKYFLNWWNKFYYNISSQQQYVVSFPFSIIFALLLFGNNFEKLTRLVE